MILFLFFATLSVYASECDGEVTACGDCTSSSETFAQCQWCSSNGNCNGKYDVLTDCPSGGQWLSTCPAPASQNPACSSSELAQLQSMTSKCANTKDACPGTACTVYLAKTLGWSAACLQLYQKACVDFVSFLCV